MANRKGGFIGQDGLNAPDEPTGVSASAGDTQAEVSFTTPSDVGGSAITGYVATSNDGIGATGSSSPITVTGLSNGSSYTFRVWALNAFGYSAPSDASGSVSPQNPRALFGGGRTTAFAADKNVIDYVTISTTGNATDFGDIASNTQELGAFSSSSRAVFFGGIVSASTVNVMQYVTILSTGNATDFGDLTAANAQSPAGVSSNTRGVRAGGRDPNVGATNTMDYVTIASAGNATDFGDLLAERHLMSSCNSSTRGIFSGGSVANVIQYITIASTGNAIDFGDLSESLTQLAAGIVSSSTRGIVSMGGRNASTTPVNNIEYVTIASTGNSTDFGDLTTTVYELAGASSTTRGLAAGGLVSNDAVNTIQYITIASTGNSASFGDLTLARYRFAGASNVHGGLS